MNFHACIFRSYSDASGIARVWSSKCDKLAIAEHPAEGQTQRVHIHILVSGSHVAENRLRELLKETFPDIRRGQYWIATKTKKEKLPVGERETLIYILKGERARLKFQNNFSDTDVEDALKAWVIPASQNVPSTSNTVIYEVASKTIRKNLNKEIIGELLTWYLLEKKKFVPGTLLPRDPSVEEIVTEACRLVRSHGRGINPFQIRDFVLAVQFEEPSSRQAAVQKIISLAKL